jgi:hypothetical protein
MTYRGFIQEFRGSWGSGLACLRIVRVNGTVVEVPCENAKTVWALDHWFGSLIDRHTARIPEEVQKIEVAYSVDELGILVAFSPYKTWLARRRPAIPVDGIDDDAIYRAVQKIIRTGKVS